MIHRTQPLACLVACGLLAGLAAGASAATVTMTDVNPATTMNVSFPGIDYTPAPLVGTIRWTFDRSAPDNAGLAALIQGNTLSTFCIEGTQDAPFLSTGSYPTILTNLADAPQDNVGSLFKMGSNATTLAKFWDAYYDTSSMDAIHAAAFQLGIWEIVYDNGTDLSTGSFKATAVGGDATSAAARSQAQMWLGALPSVTPTAHYDLYVLSDPEMQDQLFGVKQGAPVVPLPAALPMGMSLLAGLGVLRGFRRR
jgi:hypothetical protein